MIVNLYKNKTKDLEENPESPRLTYRQMIIYISTTSGIGQRTVQNTLAEYRNKGTVSSPKKKKCRPTILEKLDDFDKKPLGKKYIVFGATVKYLQFRKF